MQVSIDGLRSVPLDILKRLESVPEAYLQELGEDHNLFAELPIAVQRQVRASHAVLVLACMAWHNITLMIQDSNQGMHSRTQYLLAACHLPRPTHARAFPLHTGFISTEAWFSMSFC